MEATTVLTQEQIQNELATYVLPWVSKLATPPLDPNKSLQQNLRDGVVLCNLINTFIPDFITKIHPNPRIIRQMENLRNYLSACVKLGIPEDKTFEPIEFHENKEMDKFLEHMKYIIENIEKLSASYIPRRPHLRSVSSEEHSDPEASSEEYISDKLVSELVAWVNSQLARRTPVVTISNISSDLSSGVVLIQLLEVVTSGFIEFYNREPSGLVEGIQNATIVMNYLAAQTLEKFADCTPSDIVHGREECIVLLLEYIRGKFDLDYLFRSLINGESQGLVQEIEDELDEEEPELSPSPNERPGLLIPQASREYSEVETGTPKSGDGKMLDLKNIFKLNRRSASPNSLSVFATLSTSSSRSVQLPQATVGVVVEKVRVNPLGPLLRKQKRPTIKIVRKIQQVITVPDDGNRLESAQLLLRRKIAEELLQTEKTYVQSLSTIEGLHQSLCKHKVLSDEDTYSIFSNVAELLQLHTELLNSLQLEAKNWSNDVSIGTLFLEKFNFINKYKPYIHTHNSSFSAVYYLSKRHPNFDSFLKHFEAEQKKTTQLNLEAYLIMPVQRIPRYILLFQDLLKYTRETHPDFVAIPKLLDRIRTEMTDINQTMVKDELQHSKKMIQIENSIEGTFETFVHPKRRFIREGYLSVKEKEDKQKPKSRKKRESYFFLFNDFLLHCEAKKNPKDEKLFDYVEAVQGSRISKVSANASTLQKEGKERGEFSFNIVVDREVWTLYAATEAERVAWLKDLAKVIKK